MILSVSSRAFADACARLGLDVPDMLDEAGIDPATLSDPDGRLPEAAVRRLWAIARARSRDPDLALHAAEALPFGAYRAIDFLVANAPDLGAGLAKLAEYFPLINPAVRLSLEVEGDRACFGLRPQLPGTLGRDYAEYTLCACFLRTRRATGVDFPLQAVHFEHPSPASVAEHARIFGCPVRFGQRASEWHMQRGWLDEPVAHALGDLFSVLDTHARLLAARAPSSPLLDGLRRSLTACLPSGPPSLAAAAGALGMSPRTLQRKLAERGLTYRDVLDGLRRDLATAALERGVLCIGEVGFLLGFGTQPSFCRAFKRWTGMSPKQWRRRVRAPGD